MTSAPKPARYLARRGAETQLPSSTTLSSLKALPVTASSLTFHPLFKIIPSIISKIGSGYTRPPFGVHIQGKPLKPRQRGVPLFDFPLLNIDRAVPFPQRGEGEGFLNNLVPSRTILISTGLFPYYTITC